MLDFLVMLADLALWDHSRQYLPDWSHYNTLNAMVGFGYTVLSFDPNI